MKKKNRLVAGLLGVFLGCLGIHNFYLGKIKRGGTQLTLFILGIVALIKGYIVLFGSIFVTLINPVNYYYVSIFDFPFIFGIIFFYILLFIALILMYGAQIWGYVEGALILVGKIDKDGKNEGFGEPVPKGQKSRIAAGILGITVGALGIHNFYLGNTGKGIAQLLLTVLGGCILIGPIVALIWSLVESIQLFTGKIVKDGKGNPLFTE